MRSPTGVLIVAVALASSACAPEPAAQSVDSAVEEQAIRAISMEWLELDRQRDAAKIAALFADDGRLLLGGVDPVVGAAAVRDFMTKDFEANPQRTIDWRTDRVEVAASGDFAVEYGSYSIKNGTDRTEENRGSYVTVYRKIDGQWKVAADAPVLSADVTRTDDEAKIRAIAGTYQTAYNEHDASHYGALWAPDAEAIILDNEHAVGRDAILRAQEAFWASSPKLRMNLTVNTVRFVGRDVAIADFTRDGEVRNRGTWILHRRDGTWLIVALRVTQAPR